MAAILAPMLGGSAAAWLVLLAFRDAAGSGLTHTKAALYVSDGFVPPSPCIGKFIACATSIGSICPVAELSSHHPDDHLPARAGLLHVSFEAASSIADTGQRHSGNALVDDVPADAQ
jgi:hypothetical protein